MINQPSIDEIISLLEKFEPETINRIRLENPEFKETLRLGIECGEDESSDLEKSNEELKLRAAVASSGLKSLLTLCAEKKGILVKRLQYSKNVAFTSKALATICSASLLTMIARKNYEVSIVLGVINIVISLVNIFHEHINSGFLSQKKFDDIFLKMIDSCSRAEVLVQELNFFLSSPFSFEGTANNVNNANKLIYAFNKDIRPYIEAI